MGDRCKFILADQTGHFMSNPGRCTRKVKTVMQNPISGEMKEVCGVHKNVLLRRQWREIFTTGKRGTE